MILSSNIVQIVAKVGRLFLYNSLVIERFAYASLCYFVMVLFIRESRFRPMLQSILSRPWRIFLPGLVHLMQQISPTNLALTEGAIITEGKPIVALGSRIQKEKLEVKCYGRILTL